MGARRDEKNDVKDGARSDNLREKGSVTENAANFQQGRLIRFRHVLKSGVNYVGKKVRKIESGLKEEMRFV